MNAAMDVGICFFVVFAGLLNNRNRFVCSRGIIKIDQWLTVNGSMKYRKVFTDSLDIIAGGIRNGSFQIVSVSICFNFIHSVKCFDI